MTMDLTESYKMNKKIDISNRRLSLIDFSLITTWDAKRQTFRQGWDRYVWTKEIRRIYQARICIWTGMVIAIGATKKEAIDRLKSKLKVILARNPD